MNLTNSLFTAAKRLFQGILLVFVAFQAAAAPPAYVYYSQSSPNASSAGTHYYIGRIDLSNRGNDNDLWLETGIQPWGIALSASEIFWANRSENFIGRATLGDSPTPDNTWLDTSAGGAFAAANPFGVAQDGTYIYWTDPNNDQIGRARLDGSGTPDIPWISCPAGSQPTGMKVYGAYIYWTMQYTGNNGEGAIGRALRADKNSADHAFISSLNDPTDVSLNYPYIYWASNNDSAIGRADLRDLSMSQPAWLPGCSNIVSLATSSSIYWGGAHNIGTAALDGSGNIDNFASSGGDNFFGIAATDSPTLISLASLTATAQANQVSLAWTTGSETDTTGFNVWRATQADGAFAKVNAALLPATGTDIGGGSYTWTDTSVTAGQTYFYKLEDVDTHGNTSFHGPVSAKVGTGSLIASFQATPPGIFAGGASLLSWTVTGAPTLTLEGLGAVTGASKRVTPATTTSYALTDAQGDRNVVTVTVKPFALPDMTGLSKAWGSAKGQPAYDPCYDLNSDGKVDDADIALCFQGL